MTARKNHHGAGGPAASAEVVSIAPRGVRAGVAAQVAAARAQRGETPAEFAGFLSSRVGWQVRPDSVESWERGASPPGGVLWVCLMATGGISAADGGLLDSVPGGFPAEAIEGPWVTAYQFTHAGLPHHHADVAHVTAEDGRLIRAVNHPPEPRTQGRASPFLNQIEGRLFGRHLIGTWRNVSDTRYYGALELAVLPGETVMDGCYSGVASDIEVSWGRWRWVRLEDGDDMAGLALADPSALYELVMSRTQDDPPLTIDEIREDT
jgi:hypothetical protein